VTGSGIELVASAPWRVGERVDDRIRRRTAGEDAVHPDQVVD